MFSLYLPSRDMVIQCLVPDSGEKLHVFLNALAHGLRLQTLIMIKYSLYHFCLKQKYSGDLI